MLDFCLIEFRRQKINFRVPKILYIYVILNVFFIFHIIFLIPTWKLLETLRKLVMISLKKNLTKIKFSYNVLHEVLLEWLIATFKYQLQGWGCGIQVKIPSSHSGASGFETCLCF